MEYVTAAATAGATLIAAMSLWHAVVIKPIKDRIGAVEGVVGTNSTHIQGLQIDHAKLATTLESLAKAIDRLTDKFERD